VETVQVVEVHVCETCGEDLGHTPCVGHERRTKIDIIFEKVVSHVDAEIKECPRCQARTKGHFPADMPGPLQYGPGVKAYVLSLLIAQMVSLKRVQQSIKTLIGQVISEATMLKYVLQLHNCLERWERLALEQILAMPAMHVDETSLRVEKKNYWVHVCSAGEITLKFLHPKRGCEAIEAIGVIPRYGGVVIHDCWASYLSYNHCGHGLCGSPHLLRELTFIVEANGYAWAANMKRLLQETCIIVAKHKSKQLTRTEYRNLQKRYRNILTRGAKELPPIPLRQNGQRGRIAKTDAHNLWERMQQHETAVLLFAKLPYVSFTNNRAERDLRMSKVKQKVSGCFRSKAYAEAYCRISSYLQTMATKGYNPLVAIQMALSGQIYAKGGE
jgi:transposase